MGIISRLITDIAYTTAHQIGVDALHNGVQNGIQRVADARAQNLPPLTVPPGQRVFGVPGASLYTADALDAGARSAGIQGEQRVAAELERLAAEYQNTYVFHSVKLNGHLGDIDHLVVQGSRMLLVDSKNWKRGATYDLYRSTPEADYFARDGQDFAGGEIHLTRQVQEWADAFADAYMVAGGMLVVADRESTLTDGTGRQYAMGNIDDLAATFMGFFSASGAPELHPAMLTRLLYLLQGDGAPAQQLAPAPGGLSQLAPGKVPALLRGSAPTKTRLLVAWSILNWIFGLMVFMIIPLSAVPLLIVTHAHLRTCRANGLRGQGFLVTVLFFTYTELALWVPSMVSFGHGYHWW